MCVLCPQDRAIAAGADPSRVHDFRDALFR